MLLSRSPGPPHSEHEALASKTQQTPPCRERLFSAASAAPSTPRVILHVPIFSVLGGLPSNVRAAPLTIPLVDLHKTRHKTHNLFPLFPHA